jgi:branched-chain amino acid transport system ATP-binding protein
MTAPEESTAQDVPSAGIGSDTKKAAVETVELCAGYGDIAVLHDISLRVWPGNIAILLGANGAGKTTLLLAVVGALPLASGRITIGGRPAAKATYRRARSGMAFVGDDRSVFPSLSVAENLRVGSANIDEALALFPELGDRMRVTAGLLSGGEQQMLTLARALARKPSILLVDELSLGLAPMIAQRLLDRIAMAARETGMGVLLVEQHVRQALRYADWGYVLSHGRVVIEGSGIELQARIEKIEESYLGGSPGGATRKADPDAKADSEVGTAT